MKVQLYMQDYKVKNIDKHTKKETTIRFGDKTDKKSARKEYIHSMVSQIDWTIEYTSMEAKIMSIIMNEINNQDTVKRSSFTETFNLKQEIMKLGQKGYEEIYGEMLHIHQIICFKPIKVADFNPRERKISSIANILTENSSEELKQENEIMEVRIEHGCKNKRHQVLLHIWKV